MSKEDAPNFRYHPQGSCDDCRFVGFNHFIRNNMMCDLYNFELPECIFEYRCDSWESDDE
jgi:hypothetical protein